MKKILIITNSHDLHADLLPPKLIQKNHQPFRINLDQFPRDYQFIQSFIKGNVTAEIIHIPSGESIQSADIAAVWMRKPAEFNFISDDLAKQELAFAKTETEHALLGFIYSLDCYWMSHPLKMRAAMWKAEQLITAQKLGFIIPDSIITNSADKVHSFNSVLNTPMIFKTLSSPDLAADTVSQSDVIHDSMPTTIITNDMLKQLDAVNLVPSHFQGYVEKQYELRVTVIGKEIFAAKINSQDDIRTQVDSRDLSASIDYQSIELPLKIKQQCFDFVASYQLNFSALDFIVTPQNEYVFLENNPNGQFLYIEQLIPEFHLLDTLANTLIKEVECRSQ